jgi:F-type H+-transporting ATPase subunit b
MEETTKKKRSRWKWVLIAGAIYLVVFILMNLLGAALKKFGVAGQMVGFTSNLPIQMANMVILIWALNKLLYRPVLSFMEERNNRIQRQMAEAEADRKKAEEQVKQTGQELEKIRKESSGMLRQARQDAEEERRRLIQEAEKERSTILEKAQREIDLQVKKAKAEIRGEVARLAVQISRQVIGQALGESDLNRLAEESLSQMESQSANR